MNKLINIQETPNKWCGVALLLVLVCNTFCMFVVQELSEKNSDKYFFTIRKHLRVSNDESVASPIFDSSCSPKGAFAYNSIFDMQEENPIVITGWYASVTDPSSLSKFYDQVKDQYTLQERVVILKSIYTDLSLFYKQSYKNSKRNLL